MEPLLLYFGKMILCSAVMFAYYLLFLKDKTFHHYNRFYLLLSVIISLVLPLIKVSYFTIETDKNLYLLLSQLNQNQLQTTTNYDITIYSVFYAIIGVVSIILLIRLIVGILRIQSIKKQFPNETIEGIKFYQTNLNNAPFSFFRNLFWKQTIQLDSPVGQQILKHEMVHIQQKHSWDKLLMQVTKSVFWFNPVFYFINKEINLIHEYLADKKAVKKSDTKAFAQMLLESHFSGSILPVTSPFLSSNLKKRLTMITKNQTKYSYARKLFALPILFFMVFAYMVNAKNKEIKETNKAIEIAVNEMKNDTIKPKTSEFDSLSMSHQKQTQLYSEALKEDHLKMSALSTKMAEKSKALSALKKAKKEDSSEYKALENDLENLSNKMQSIVDSDNYQKNLKGLEEHSEAMAKMYDSPEFKKRIADAEKAGRDAEAMVNSPEFKKRIADAEKQAKIAERMMNSPKFQRDLKNAQNQAEKMQIKVNSPEFQKMIQDAQKRAQDAVEKYGKIYTGEEFQKMIKDQYGKDAFADGTVAYGFDASDLPDFKDFSSNFNYNFSNDVFYNTEKTTLTPKELKKFEKKRAELQKKQKELLEEQKKLQKKQQELNKEARQNNPLKISFNSNLDSPKTLVYNKNITPPQRISKSNQVIIFDKTTDGNPQRVFKADAIKIINTSDTKGSFNPNKAKVYINGKLTDIKEVDKLDPNMIASVNIFSANDAGKIEIITK
ncbi:M56 family metallopeptidase [Epilithonimonas zeae]|uniref:Signal transducer regulating beta-lactamase production, contains metallopeptidase domain n=1 Tax=Epilithonimonas zeae TaxID=1416779 RepID=A0A1N6EFS7_9FLAO|nr:M56 family metallopeptidase [Epilithonimonas zeae]SIN81870.1 Signal transducer regulating beta-lactamase production, contains metallopeptidase domain [Epilithonimonas zeae]